jgi:hypothetical protein
MEQEINRNERWLYGLADDGFDSDIDSGTYNGLVLDVLLNKNQKLKTCVVIKSNCFLTIKFNDICFLGKGEYGHYILNDNNKLIQLSLHECHKNSKMYFEGTWSMDNEIKGFWILEVKERINNEV